MSTYDRTSPARVRDLTPIVSGAAMFVALGVFVWSGWIR